jgi:beta-phosphoglucomutase
MKDFGKMNIEGVVFDVDGVLFDTEALHQRAWIAAMKSFGIDLDTASLLRWTGIPCTEMAEYYVKEYTPKRDPLDYVNAKRHHFQILVEKEAAPFEGLSDRLDQLLNTNLRMGYATSNSRKDVDLLMRVTGFDRYFPFGISLDEVQNPKPHPEPYKNAVKMLDLSPSSCVAVEDSPTGLQAALSAGMYTIGIISTFGREELSPAHTICSKTIDACNLILNSIDK